MRERTDAGADRRRQSRSSVYHYLYETRDFCTRQSLAKALDLSLPTIYQNLTELVDAGLVRYAGQSQSTGGRRPAAWPSSRRPGWRWGWPSPRTGCAFPPPTCA